MGKAGKYLLIFLIFDAVVIGGYFGFKALKGRGETVEPAAWVMIDESYRPQNDVEDFIMTDAENRGALPVYIRNYGADGKALARFKGKNFAKPSAQVLSMFFKGMDDWMLVDIKYKTESEREVVRTVLYVFSERQWRVGDTGSLIQ